jgi:outer membrane lipoprotein LolB
MIPRLAAALLLLSVAACAHVPTGSDGLNFVQRQARLASLDQWQLRGRIAVETDDRAFQGSLAWAVEPDGISLTVRGPLGAGAMQVTGTPERLVLISRGEQRVLSDPESELSALLGWWMPVQSLRYWLLGLPDPDYAANANYGQDGVVTTLEQRLWQLSYDRYAMTNGLLLPQRIALRHRELSMNLVVDRWNTSALN